MKKLLSILAAIGLTASASTAAVSCTSVTQDVSNVTIDKSGKVNFKLDSLKMDKDYKNIDVLNADYGIFNTDKSFVVSAGLVATAKKGKTAPTSFEKGKTYSFTASFSIPSYDKTKTYSFYFGTKNSDNKLDENLGGMTIVGDTTGKGNNGQKFMEFKGNFDAKFKAGSTLPSDSDLAKDFPINGADGKAIPNVEYKISTKDAKLDKTYMLDDAKDINATITYSFK